MNGNTNSEFEKQDLIRIANYRIISLLGKGSHSEVFLAENEMTKMKVALKLLLNKQVSSTIKERFRREAQAISKLDHENIVKVYSYGISDTGQAYMALEYIQGLTLETYLIQQGRLKPELAVSFALQIALALQHAHERGILHRDLKPANVILENNTYCKLADFGIASIFGKKVSHSQKLTGTMEIIGSSKYMSPEQCLNKPLNNSSDMYSLCCVLFELITGISLFDSDSDAAIMLKHVQEIPKLKNEYISRDLKHFLQKGLSKDSKDRFKNDDEFIQNLSSLRLGQGLNIFKREEKIIISICIVIIMSIIFSWSINFKVENTASKDTRAIFSNLAATAATENKRKRFKNALGYIDQALKIYCPNDLRETRAKLHIIALMIHAQEKNWKAYETYLLSLKKEIDSWHERSFLRSLLQVWQPKYDFWQGQLYLAQNNKTKAKFLLESCLNNNKAEAKDRFSALIALESMYTEKEYYNASCQILKLISGYKYKHMAEFPTLLMFTRTGLKYAIQNNDTKLLNDWKNAVLLLMKQNLEIASQNNVAESLAYISDETIKSGNLAFLKDFINEFKTIQEETNKSSIDTFVADYWMTRAKLAQNQDLNKIPEFAESLEQLDIMDGLIRAECYYYIIDLLEKGKKQNTKYYQETLEKCIESFKLKKANEHSILFIYALNKAAEIYTTQKHYTKALECYKLAIKEQLKFFSNNIEIHNTLTNQMNHLIELKNKS